MAIAIQATWASVPGLSNVVAVLLNPLGQWWDTDAETYQSWEDVDIPYLGIAATEYGNTGIYHATVPADAQVEGVVTILWIETADGTLAESDFPASAVGKLGSALASIDGSADAAANLRTACSAYSATRGLSGTALPNAVAGETGGLPTVNEYNFVAGVQTILSVYLIDDAITNETIADAVYNADIDGYGAEGTYGERLKAILADWLDGGRLDLLLDAIPTASVYFADLRLERDNVNSRDEWTVQWFKNDAPVASAITLPKLQVVKRADGTELIAATAMTQIGDLSAFRLDEATDRLTPGEAVLAIATARIDGATRTWSRLIGRDG